VLLEAVQVLASIAWRFYISDKKDGSVRIVRIALQLLAFCCNIQTLYHNPFKEMNITKYD